MPTGKFAMRRDPRVYAMDLPPLVPMHKRIVGLDLGINCGISFTDVIPGHPVRGATMTMGQWDLSVGKYDSGVLRYVRLEQFLTILNPSLIYYELVKYTPPQLPRHIQGSALVHAVLARAMPAAELIGSLKLTVARWAELNNVPCEGISIQDIKKYATGKGNASKEDMIVAANEQFGTKFATEDYESTGVDNIVDSAFLCTLGVQLYSEGPHDSITNGLGNSTAAAATGGVDHQSDVPKDAERGDVHDVVPAS